MRVLSVSDKVVPQLYSTSVLQYLTSVDLILGCGDLPYEYLEFLVSTYNAPAYFVAGNHDRPLQYDMHGWLVYGPRGCVNLHGRVVWERGLLLGGLEGSIRYNDRPHFQYTDTEMWFHVLRLAPRLKWNELVHGRSLDILITHAPPFGIHDLPDRAHQGFRALLWLVRRFQPRYLIHGHIHVYGLRTRTVTALGQTQIINTYGHRLLEIEPPCA